MDTGFLQLARHMVSNFNSAEAQIPNHYTSSVHEIVSVLSGSMTSLGLTKPSYPRSEDEETKTKNVWLKGHTGQPLIRIPVSMLLMGCQTSGLSRFCTANLLPLYKS